WLCTYDGCVPVGAIRRQSPRSCSARAPGSSGSSASIALANWASPSTPRVNAPPLGGRRTTVLLPVVQRSLAMLLKAPPRAYGWCRTRWSGATLAAQLTAKHGRAVSAWTVRRWLHELGWVWKRVKLVAKDDDPQRVERLAKPRHDALLIEGE